jgi:hypothetical protein
LPPPPIFQLGGIDSIPPVIEGTVHSVVDVLVEVVRVNPKISKEEPAKLYIEDFVGGADVVDLVNPTLAQDRVNCVRGVAGEEVPAGVLSVTVEEELFVPLKEAGKFRDDFCWGREACELENGRGEGGRGSLLPGYWWGRLTCYCGR